MTLTQGSAPPSTYADARRAARPLIASLVVFVIFLPLAALSMPVQTAGDLTVAQLADMRVAWVAMHLLWAMPVPLGCLGLLRLAPALPPRTAAITRVFAAIAGFASLVYLVPEMVLLGSEGPLLRDDPFYLAGLALSMTAFWAGLVATIVTGVGLIRQRLVPKAAVTVVVLAGVHLVLDLLVVLPAIVGEPELADATGLPPFLLAVTWTILGASLLRSARRSERGGGVRSES